MSYMHKTHFVFGSKLELCKKNPRTSDFILKDFKNLHYAEFSKYVIP